jgi:hypothetical protein
MTSQGPGAQTAPDAIIHAIKQAFESDSPRLAERLAREGAKRYPEHAELLKYARVLAPPTVRLASSTPESRAAVKANRKWLKANRHDYLGNWIALKNGELLHASSTFDDLTAAVGDVRGRGILVTKDRLLFVKRRLKPSERKRLLSITRGFPQLRKLREIMDHLYALFDRRCRTQTALDRLKKLRQWVKRFKWIGDTLHKVFSSNLEKALTFLDDKLLPATSNAVERGNRRHRKMQKSVYRVRSKICLEGRIALDMIRESRAESRDQTTAALHKARRGYT